MRSLVLVLFLLAGCGIRLPSSPLQRASFLTDADTQAILSKIISRRHEVLTARTLLKGTVTQGKSKFTGKYSVVTSSEPFRVRVELFPLNFGPSLFVGSFTESGGVLIEGTGGDRQTLSNLEIPLVESGPRYDLSVLVPLLAGRMWNLNPPKVVVLDGGSGTLVFDKEKNVVAEINEDGFIQDAFFLADNGRVRAQVSLQFYHEVDGVMVPQTITLKEYSTDSSGYFEVVALSLNRPIKDETFLLAQQR